MSIFVDAEGRSLVKKHYECKRHARIVEIHTDSIHLLPYHADTLHKTELGRVETENRENIFGVLAENFSL